MFGLLSGLCHLQVAQRGEERLLVRGRVGLLEVHQHRQVVLAAPSEAQPSSDLRIEPANHEESVVDAHAPAEAHRLRHR